MKFCRKCGRQVSDDERFCMCGTVLNNDNIVSRKQMIEKVINNNDEFNPDLFISEQDIEGTVIKGYRIIKQIFHIFGHYYYQAVKADGSSVDEVVIEHITVTENSYSDLYYINSGMNHDVFDMMKEFSKKYVENIISSADKKFLFECFHIVSELNHTVHIVSIYRKSRPVCMMKNELASFGLKLMELEESFSQTISDVNIWADDDGNLYAVPFALSVRQHYFVMTPDILYMKTFQSEKKYYASGMILIRLMNGYNMPFTLSKQFNAISFSQNEKRRRKGSIPVASAYMNTVIWKAAELMMFSDNADLKRIAASVLKNLY